MLSRIPSESVPTYDHFQRRDSQAQVNPYGNSCPTQSLTASKNLSVDEMPREYMIHLLMLELKVGIKETGVERGESMPWFFVSS
jgi:hypothetical protein